jgi:hypothetical protein
MRLEWLQDSAFRFFPTQRDDFFGYVLHPVDLATNKAAAAADRGEPRDLVDLITIHEGILPLGAVLCAADASRDSRPKKCSPTSPGIVDSQRRSFACWRRINRSIRPVFTGASVARLKTRIDLSVIPALAGFGGRGVAVIAGNFQRHAEVLSTWAGPNRNGREQPVSELIT